MRACSSRILQGKYTNIVGVRSRILDVEWLTDLGRCATLGALHWAVDEAFVVASVPVAGSSSIGALSLAASNPGSGIGSACWLDCLGWSLDGSGAAYASEMIGTMSDGVVVVAVSALTSAVSAGEPLGVPEDCCCPSPAGAPAASSIGASRMEAV